MALLVLLVLLTAVRRLDLKRRGKALRGVKNRQSQINNDLTWECWVVVGRIIESSLSIPLECYVELVLQEAAAAANTTQHTQKRNRLLLSVLCLRRKNAKPKDRRHQRWRQQRLQQQQQKLVTKRVQLLLLQSQY